LDNNRDDPNVDSCVGEKVCKLPLPPPTGHWVSGEALDADVVFSDAALPESPPSNAAERGSPITTGQIPLDERDLDDLSDPAVFASPLGMSNALKIAVVETPLDETDLDDLSEGSEVEGKSVYRAFTPSHRGESEQISTLTLTEEEEEEPAESLISVEDTEVQAAPVGSDILEKEWLEEEVVLVDVGTTVEASGSS
jgi:hypothetical protein